MTNYRVRQVLALGPMPDRQLRLLVALATWLSDETRVVRVGFDKLIEASGNTRNTVRRARRELEEDGRVSSVTTRGRGNLAVWTVHCLPEKGVSDVDPFSKGVSDVDPFPRGKGVNQAAEKGSISTEKRGQPQLADQQEPDTGLNRRANPSSSLSRALADLAAAVPTLTEREIESISDRLKDNPEIPHPGPYLQAVIGNGDAVTFAAAVLNGHDRRPRHGRQAETDGLFDRAMERARALEAAGVTAPVVRGELLP